MSSWWSFALTAVALVELELLGRARWRPAGWVVMAAVQVPWAAFAVLDHQPWFIVSATVYATQALRNLARDLSEREELGST